MKRETGNVSARRKCGHAVRVKGRCLVCYRKWNRERKRQQHPRRAELLQTPDAVWDRGEVARLGDGYVRQLLSTGTRIPASAWPAELVRLKRVTVLAKRIVKA